MKKTISRIVILALFVTTAITMTAQKSDGFFNTYNEDIYQDRSIESIGLDNQTFGQDVPLSGGLLIMFAAGAGYAIYRRKRNFKNGSTLLLAFALLLGMTQCKKNVETITPLSNTVHITINVDDGSKADVNTTTGEVDYADGDVIYVGNNGAYCGYLTYDGSVFSGDIAPTSGDDTDYLHFYFMGNKGGTSGAPTSVDIIDQRSQYPVISYGRSSSLYNSGTTSYHATLLNKCALVKFSITGVDTDKDITIKGMNNTVTVNFNANKGTTTGEPYTFDQSGNGEIKLHASTTNAERWAILLPQSEVTAATANAPGYTTSSNFTVPAISDNGFDTDGVTITLKSDGSFTVNSDGKRVIFAPGNLQYTISSSTWSFMEHQYTTVETTGDNEIGVDYSNRDIVSLFFWGASGYTHTNGEVNCYPNRTVYDAAASSANGDASANLYDYNGIADWGRAANYAQLGGYNNWRTLKADDGNSGKNNEWDYIMNSRETGITISNTIAGGYTTENARYGKAIINVAPNNLNNGTADDGVFGFILLPDTYAGPFETNQGNLTTSGIKWGKLNDATINDALKFTKCTADGWATLEAAGCVFLPAAAYRSNQRIYPVGATLCYWSSSSNGTSNANAFWAGKSFDWMRTAYSLSRAYGMAVRLVRDIE